MLNSPLLRNGLGVVFIAFLAALLYTPFLNNGLIFDDHNVFTNLMVFDQAQVLFDGKPRTFPYFTLGLVEVLFGTIESHRIVSIVLHILSAAILFALLHTLLRQALTNPGSDAARRPLANNHALIISVVGASWFAIHPVAAYGAGYLVQRTIVFATIFSLLSLWFYRRAFAENRSADIFTAALFYSAAVFSKEHAIALPLAALPLAALYQGEWRTKAMRMALYLALCVPAGIMVYMSMRSLVTSGYEPNVSNPSQLLPGVSLMKESWGPWLVSAILQTGAFFDYLYYWIIPDVRTISIDMRVDFAAAWGSAWLIPKTILFLLCPLLALACLIRSGKVALFGCGLFYTWILFLPELSAMRFQEPLVLYRSYLWAPGIVMMLVAVLAGMPARYALAASAITLPLLFVGAHDRLKSMTSEHTVWEDAAAKLPSPDAAGADRIYYNRGGERLKQGMVTEAMDDLNKVVAMNPSAYYGYLGRGLIYLKMQDHARALDEFDRVLGIKPEFGLALYRKGLALEALDRDAEALKAYEAAANAGDALGKLRFTYLKNSTR